MKKSLSKWLGRTMNSNTLAIALTTFSAIAGIITYLVLTQYSPLASDPEAVSLLLAFDLALLASLAGVIAWRLFHLLRAQRQGLAGARLQLRLVLTFTLLAVVPSVAVAGLSALFFFAGVQSWFDETVSSAVRESKEVAEAALDANQRTILGDALSLANSIDREMDWISGNDDRLEQILLRESVSRGFTEAVVFANNGRVLARADLGFSLKFDTVLDVEFDRARGGEVVMMVNRTENRVRALLRLDRDVDAYLLVSRPTDSALLAHMQKAEQAAAQYGAFEQKRVDLQSSIMLIFVVVALVLLMASVLLGLEFANRLIRPIGNIINAAERIRGGDLTVRVPQTLDDRANELGQLIRSFNRMTNQLQTQRRELIDANRQVDERRRFSEAVLAGVSAGVLDVDAEGTIRLANHHASDFLGQPPDVLIGQPLVELMPELVPFKAGERQIQAQGRTLLVRIAPELVGAELRGYVITLDEVTDLITAQRKAAWADVARRLAHEVKNPLTPIQLSAERLKRKYMKEITTEPDVFRDCTETIVRQVDDIRRLIDEFSDFARMPAPVIRPNNLSALLREAVILQRHAHPDIQITSLLPAEDVKAECDAPQLRQVLTNLIINSIDAIHERGAENGELPKGQIEVSLREEAGKITVAVADNGKGLPTDNREKLTDPYVTTKVKGTGLGLAIVKNIMADHAGKLALADRPGGGAMVTLVFPRRVGYDTEAGAHGTGTRPHGASLDTTHETAPAA